MQRNQGFRTTVVGILLLILFLCSVNAVAGIDDGLVAYYPFNGNARDESGNMNDGSVNEATKAVDRFENDDSAYYFDGVNDYVTVPNNSSQQISSNQITESAWIQLSTDIGDEQWRTGQPGDLIYCDDPEADNYNSSSGCGCKYSDLFDEQQNSLCPSEISMLVLQEWMDTDFCLLLENGSKNWTKAQYQELLNGLGNVYNLSDYEFFEYDVCDRTPGEYVAEKYNQPYENGDCRIDGVNQFTFPTWPWDGTFVSNLLPGDLYWHFSGFMVRTEEATQPFSCCKQMFESDDWTKFASPECDQSGDLDGMGAECGACTVALPSSGPSGLTQTRFVTDTDCDGIPEDGDASGSPGDNPCTDGNMLSCDDNCPDDANADQVDGNADGVGDVCESPGAQDLPEPYMLKDINPDQYGNGSRPEEFIDVNGMLYFSADDGFFGRELWKSDGTPAGTRIVTDIDNGIGDSYPIPLTSHDNKLYFYAYEQGIGFALWVSDGTEAGTMMLRDLSPSTESSLYYYIDETVYNGKLYFDADDGIHGSEVWLTDGTPDGTQMLKDINPTGSNKFFGFTEYQDRLFFAADDGTHGREVWVTDGTSNGTKMFKDINPGSAASNAAFFTLYNGLLYFSADDGTNGEELWVTDGTESGTGMVTNIAGDGLEPLALVSACDYLYFLADDNIHGYELWISDGTEAGTRMVKDINNGSGDSWPGEIICCNDKLYFAEYHSGELWGSDGTEAGTRMVKDINPESGSNPQDLTCYDNSLYFSAEDDSSSRNLWVSDGTEGGTLRVENSDLRRVDDIAVAGDRLYFQGYGWSTGEELWTFPVCGDAILEQGEECLDDSDCRSLYGFGYTCNVECQCEETTMVTLAGFDAVAGNRQVRLTWETVAEIDNIGFNIYRSVNGGVYEQINTELIPAAGSPTEGAIYEVVDKNVRNRTEHSYILEDIDLNGIATENGPVLATPRVIYGISW